jgi:hypothetical protein
MSAEGGIEPRISFKREESATDRTDFKEGNEENQPQMNTDGHRYSEEQGGGDKQLSDQATKGQA